MKKYLKIVGNILTVIAILYIVKTIYGMKINFEIVSNRSALVVALAVGFVIMLVTLYLLAYAWTRIISFFSKNRFDKNRGVCIYVKANLGKYMPGNVMHYVERNLFAAEAGLDQLEVAASSVIEIAELLVTALFMCVVLAFEDLEKILTEVQIKGTYIGIAAGAVLLLGVAVFLVRRSKKAEKLRSMLKRCWNRKFFFVLFGNMLIYMVVFFLLGTAMVVIATAPFDIAVSIENARTIISSYTLAWVSGFIVPGAPGGIGIREYVFTVLTRKTEFENIILVVALLHRFMNILGDIAGYLAAILKMRKSKQEEEI